MSSYRVFDEIVVILNNSTDRTRELVEDLIRDHPRIRLLYYSNECIPIGPGYYARVLEAPDCSLARYYNWCMEQTTYSHVCKWDGDMIAIAPFAQVREAIRSYDVVAFDGYDVLGENTTDCESRIFRYDPAHVQYVDWDLYEVLKHDYGRLKRIEEKCYIHMKLVKKDWLHKQWLSPNILATRSVPDTGAGAKSGEGGAERMGHWIHRATRKVLRGLGIKS